MSKKHTKAVLQELLDEQVAKNEALEKDYWTSNRDYLTIDLLQCAIL
jgi:hypothetical protein